MRIMGIDPGINGGLAIYITGGDLDGAARAWGVIDIPTDGEGARRRVDAVLLRDWITAGRPDHCLIERAQAMPEQGSSSGFLYGRAVGALEAVTRCCNVPLTIIESRAWKIFHGLKGGSKEDSRQRALHKLPSASHFMARKMDHGRAEALLIAMYGASIIPRN